MHLRKEKEMKTEKLVVSPENPDIESLKRAASYIEKGGTVAFPTETVYGLGADALDSRAVRKIFTAKGRPQDNPLIVHVSSLEMAQEYVEEDLNDFRRITDILLPGPVTLIFHKNRLIPDEVTAGLPTVGIRFPAHPVARLLIELAGRPIAAPSANISGKPSPTDGTDVAEDMDGRVDCIVMSGASDYGLESTIVDLSGEKPVLLRPGPVSVDQLLSVLPDLEVPAFVHAMDDYEGPILAPGMKYRHYSPDTELILVEGSVVSHMVDKVEEIAGTREKTLVLCSSETSSMYREGVRKYVLGSRRDLYGIGHKLFSTLRHPPMSEVELMVVEAFPEMGIGLAIMNRLRKAAWSVAKTL